MKYAAGVALGLSPLLKKKALPFWLGSVLIDADHSLWYAVKFRDLNPLHGYTYLRARHAQPEDPAEPPPVIILHYFEVLAPLALLLGRFAWTRAFFSGMLFHMALDAYEDVTSSKGRRREYSLLGIIRERVFHRPSRKDRKQSATPGGRASAESQSLPQRYGGRR